MASKSLTVKLLLNASEFSTGIGKIEDKLESASKKFESLGKELTLKLTAPIAALGALALRSSIQFEDAFALVRKTLGDASDNELAALRQDIVQMSREIPVAATEIAKTAAAAAQLGVGVKDIRTFTLEMLRFGSSSDVAAEEAAISFARFSAVMHEPLDQVGRLAATVVGLGNRFAVTESEILDVSLRLAGVARTAGLASDQIFGLAAALRAAGVPIELGATALSSAMVEITKAVATGNEKLALFAAVAGTTAEEFATQFRDNAAQAILAFVRGLGEVDEAARIEAIEGLDLDAKRMMQTFLSLAGASDKLSESLQIAGQESEKGSAHADEARRRWATLGAEWKRTKNNLEALAIQFGDALAPAAKVVLGVLNGIIDAFRNLSPSSKEMVVTTLALAAAIGPLAFAWGKLLAIVKSWSAITSIIMANPAALGVAAIGLLLLYIRQLSDTQSGLLIQVKYVWEGIKLAISAAISASLRFLARLASFLSTTLGNALQDAANATEKWANASRTRMNQLSSEWVDLQKRAGAAGEELANAGRKGARATDELGQSMEEIAASTEAATKKFRELVAAATATRKEEDLSNKAKAKATEVWAKYTTQLVATEQKLQATGKKTQFAAEATKLAEQAIEDLAEAGVLSGENLARLSSSLEYYRSQAAAVAKEDAVAEALKKVRTESEQARQRLTDLGEGSEVLKASLRAAEEGLISLVQLGITRADDRYADLLATIQSLRSELSRTEVEDKYREVLAKANLEIATTTETLRLLGREHEAAASAVGTVESAIEALVEQGIKPEDEGLQKLLARLQALRSEVATTEAEEAYRRVLEETSRELETTRLSLAAVGRQKEIAAESVRILEDSLRSLVELGIKPTDAGYQQLAARLAIWQAAVAEQRAAEDEQLALAQSSWGQWFQAMNQGFSSIQSAAVSFSEIAFTAFQQFSSGVGEAFAQALVYGESFGDAMADVGKRMAASFIASLIDLGIQLALFAILSQTVLGGMLLGSVMASAGRAYAGGFASVMEVVPFPLNVLLAPSVAAGAAFGAMAGLSFGLFAEGGVVTGPVMGLVGEAGPEVIMPLDRLSSFLATGGETMTAILQVDGRTLARANARHHGGVVKFHLGAGVA